MWKNENYWGKASENYRHVIRGKNGYWVECRAYLNAHDKKTFVATYSNNICYRQTKACHDIKFAFRSIQAARNWLWAQRYKIYRSQK